MRRDQATAGTATPNPFAFDARIFIRRASKLQFRPFTSKRRNCADPFKSIKSAVNLVDADSAERLAKQKQILRFAQDDTRAT
jgi:hypothetical protein